MSNNIYKTTNGEQTVKTRVLFSDDNHSEIIGSFMVQSIGAPILLGADTVIDSYNVTLATGHGVIIGDEIFIAEQDNFFQAKVLNVVGDVLTLDSPFDDVYETAGTRVLKTTSELAVNGSTTPQDFIAGPSSAATEAIEIEGIRFVITDNLAMDDGKFGGIAALTRGLLMRTVCNGGATNLWNAKTNGDLDLIMDHKTYSEKGPGGEFSVSFTWDLRNNIGVSIKLLPGEQALLRVQDDLTGLTSMKAYIYGRYIND